MPTPSMNERTRSAESYDTSSRRRASSPRMLCPARTDDWTADGGWRAAWDGADAGRRDTEDEDGRRAVRRGAETALRGFETRRRAGVADAGGGAASTFDDAPGAWAADAGAGAAVGAGSESPDSATGAGAMRDCPESTGASPAGAGRASAGAGLDAGRAAEAEGAPGDGP